jgi:hypothetical protein
MLVDQMVKKRVVLMVPSTAGRMAVKRASLLVVM